MAFSSIFKTQSIVPKITKFSSSIFGGRKINQGSLVSAGPQIGETLVETNRILVEIQKQLSLDFAYRVVQEQNDIKRAKADANAAKRFRAERKAEGILGKGGSFLGGLGSKIVAPVSNVWTRLLDFFTLIGTGLVATKGLKWLSENQEFITKTFKFLEDHWVKIAAGLAIVAAISLLGKFVFLFKILKGLGVLAGALLGIGSLWGLGGKAFSSSRGGKGSGSGGRTKIKTPDKKTKIKTPDKKTKIETPNKKNKIEISRNQQKGLLKEILKFFTKNGLKIALIGDLVFPDALGDGTMEGEYKREMKKLEPSVKNVLESNMGPVTKTNVTVLDTIRQNTANMRNSSQTDILEGSNTPSVPLVRSQDNSNPLIWHTADMLGITEF